MDRIIRQITEYFVSALPEGKEHYRTEELLNYGFPAFLVRRIHIELQWNLDESMILPETDWANTQSEAVQQSWENFLKAIHAEVQLPASYAKAVIETAVADIIDMLVQPRKNITDILFGGEDTLSAADIKERTELLVVYPHFAQVLTSYMQRKGRGQLTRERCKKIIKRVDEKVTHQYTPLQWAQMLDPLFTLAGPELDSNLLRLFFEDRKMDQSARRFDMMSKAVSRAEFIEVLSSPELLNYESYGDDQPMPLDETGQDEMEDKNAGLEEPGQEAESEQPAEEKAPLVAENELTDTTASLNAETDEASEAFAKNDDAQSEDEEDQPIQPEPDFEVSSDRSGEEINEQEEQDQEQASSLNDFFVSPDNKTDGEQGREDASSIDQPAAVEEAEPQDEDEESPIWMRYMDSDAPEEHAAQEEVDARYEKERDEETVINRTESDENEQQELAERLQGDRPYFVRELFDGSERGYREALDEIAQKDSWKEASELIKHNIFERNEINIYSEAAVDFTDRLHDYFIDKENSN